jgi:hypothetical protein
MPEVPCATAASENSIASTPNTRLDEEDRLAVGTRPDEVADEPAAARQLVHELLGGALHGYLTPGARISV